MNTTTKPLNLFILVDRTGSMSTIWQNTINTINEYIGSIGTENVKINLAFFDKAHNNTFNSFNSFNLASLEASPVVQVRLNQSSTWVPLMANDMSIAPRGMTPLYDAICEYAEFPKKQGLKKSDLVQFVIITDGDENVSTKFRKADAQAVLAKFEKKGWPVVYLGANLEAFSGGGKIMSRTDTLGQYNPTNWFETARGLAGSTSRYMSTQNSVNAAFTDEERGSMK